jgi:hypothetical protein
MYDTAPTWSAWLRNPWNPYQGSRPMDWKSKHRLPECETDMKWIHSSMWYSYVLENISVKICGFLPHLLWKISSLIRKPTSQCLFLFCFKNRETASTDRHTHTHTHTHTNTVNVTGVFACSDEAVRNSKLRRVLKSTHLSLYIDTIWIRGSVDPKASLRLESQEKASGPSKNRVPDIQPIVVFLSYCPYMTPWF